MKYTATLIQEWMNDPLHWPNNRRKLAGLPVLRGGLNKKQRRLPNNILLFRAVDSDLNLMYKKTIKDQINSFADIREIKLGINVHETPP